MLFERMSVIIGYSFADPSINNAFGDWLNFNLNARMIVVARGKANEKLYTVTSDVPMNNSPRGQNLEWAGRFVNCY